MSSSAWVGSATISAIVALENARPAPESESSSKTVYFDAHLFLSDSAKRGESTQVLALLRYFNAFDYDFSPDDVHICFIVANVRLLVLEYLEPVHYLIVSSVKYHR